VAYSSRVKDALDDIVDEFGNISTSNGYYTNPTVVRAIRPADEIELTSSSKTEIGIEMGEEEMRPVDDADTTFDSTVNVYVAGTAMAQTSTDSDQTELVDATEKLRHDLKRIIAGMFTKYAPNSNNQVRWGILRGTVTIVPVMGLGKKRNKAQVWARLRIKVWSQSSDTLASQHGEAYGTAGAGFYGF